jgi:hypothetical protein
LISIAQLTHPNNSYGPAGEEKEKPKKPKAPPPPPNPDVPTTYPDGFTVHPPSLIYKYVFPN